MRRAAEIAGQVFAVGGIPYIPHLQFPWFMNEDEVSRDLALEMSTIVLKHKCDALYYRDVPTSGMRTELDSVQDTLPIFTTLVGLGEFCRTFSERDCEVPNE